MPPVRRYEPRKSRLPLLLVAFGGAALVAALLIGASLIGGGGGEPVAPPAATVDTTPHEESILGGIAQDGIALGSADAPVTLVEYADLQCPYCAEWARDAFPAIVDEYVRDGRVRIEFRGLSFIGPESEIALRAALAAGEQDRLWDVVHGLFVRQGAENGGWVTEDLLRSLGRGAGIDAERMLADSDSPSVDSALAEAAAQARAVGVPGTPFFEAGPTGGTLTPLQVSSLDADPFRAALDELLAQ
jgi:protein-disulfide isomerase